MKKIKPTKKQLLAGIITLLFTLGLFVAQAMIIANQNSLRAELNSLKEAISSQQKSINTAQIDIKSINANNGTALQMCLDKAAKDYDNTLKSTGDVKEEDGTRVTYHDYDAWQKTLDTLNSNRAKCNEQFE